MTFHDRTNLERVPPDAELTRAMRLLSADTLEIDYTGMEERLQLAFQKRQRSRARFRPVRQWGRVAAVVLMCGGASSWWLGEKRSIRPPLESRSPAVTSVVLAAPVAPADLETHDSRNPGTSARRTAARRDTAENAFPLLGDFIPLPGAAALPELEHADVVRIEVPVAGLAAYGFDMVPDATPAAVAADLLIGQDGVPRAIRLTRDRVR